MSTLNNNNMKQVNFKNVKAKLYLYPILIALTVGLWMISCTGGNSKKQSSDTSEAPTEQAANNKTTLDNSVAAAFKQFGLDLEKVKPNVTQPYDITLRYGNKVDQTVYYRKAAWMEKSETDIDPEVGTAYNRRMFEYIKSISADGKIYKNKTMEGGESVVENYSDLKGLLITWSYKYNGMWIDVYPNYSGLGEEIGISVNGSGSY